MKLEKFLHKKDDLYLSYKYIAVYCGTLTHFFHLLYDFYFDYLSFKIFIMRVLLCAVAVLLLPFIKKFDNYFWGICVVVLINCVFICYVSDYNPSTDMGIITVLLMLAMLKLPFKEFNALYILGLIFYFFTVYRLIEFHGDSVILGVVGGSPLLLVVYVIYLSIFFMQRSLYNAVEENVNLLKSINSKNNFLTETYNQLVHDVKSPLTALKFLSKEDNSENNLLKNATDRVEKIILELEQSQDVEGKLFNVVEVINSIIQEAKVKYKNISSEVVINFKYNLQNKLVAFNKIDKIIFSRIMSNLINNAFESKNSNAHLIVVKAEDINDVLTFSVHDNGIGVPLNDLELILEKGKTTKSSGKGLGLSYAKSKIESSGGSLKVTSEQGFCINFTLPVKLL